MAARWVLHLPTTLTTLTNQDDAVRLATALRDSLALVTVLDFGETTLSEEDRQLLRARVWCDARLDGAGRCRHRADHTGPCGNAALACGNAAGQCGLSCGYRWGRRLWQFGVEQ